MKIRKLVLNNFRGYSHAEINFDKNFNVIIGKNDIGKSTILEALEIFFNNETIKAEITDLSVHANDKTMSIQVSFIPDKNKQYTIDTIPTDLEKEYLLDEQGLLTIKNNWDCSKDKLSASSLKRFIVANYPEDFSPPLVVEKILKLNTLLKNYEINKDVNKTKSSSIRQAIYAAINPSNLSLQDIPIDKEDGKKIWDALKVDLPLFFLFQSDRANKDSDKEVQDPLKAITKTAIAQLENELEEVKNKIREQAERLGNHTLSKLKEMNPEIAEVLTPQMSNKSWDSLFSFSFTSDDGIPINKRGSGVRRLILLNYFRAEAERKNADKRSVIYAIEEPETSQHPDWQVELFKALIELSNNQNTQVITTTHSPSLAGLTNPNHLIFIHRLHGKITIESSEATSLNAVIETLGLLPDITINNLNAKVILCLEGPTDVEFFYNISKLFDLELCSNNQILVIPLGGSTLKHWVNQNYLDKLDIPQIHIYDSDVKKYEEMVKAVNDKENESWATLTKMREIENYIHPSLIKEIYPIQEEFILMDGNWQEEWKNKDIPNELSNFLKNLKKINLNYKSLKGEGKDTIKRNFSETAAPKMTKELFGDLKVYEEVEGWFNKIKTFL